MGAGAARTSAATQARRRRARRRADIAREGGDRLVGERRL